MEISRDKLLEQCTARLNIIVDASNRYQQKNEEREKQNEIIHKPGCIDESTCFCKYMSLEWKEEARKKEEKQEVSTEWVMCRDEIMRL